MSRSRWRSAVRSIVAINSLRPPTKLGRPESVVSEEEEPQHVPGMTLCTRTAASSVCGAFNLHLSLMPWGAAAHSVVCKLKCNESSVTETCGSAGILSPKTDAVALLRLVIGSWMSLFLIAVPLGLSAQVFNWGPIAIFVLVQRPETCNFSTPATVHAFVATLGALHRRNLGFSAG